MSAIRLWVDAFTVQLDVLAEGFENPTLVRSVMDGAKEIVAAHGAGSPVAANQASVMDRFRRHDYEQWRVVREAWRVLGAKLVAHGWSPFDMAMERDPFGKKHHAILVHETDALAKPLPLGTQEAMLVEAFLRFVAETAQNDTFDPRVEIKARLEKQGITKDNFHLHAGRLLISDPWAEERGTP